MDFIKYFLYVYYISLSLLKDMGYYRVAMVSGYNAKNYNSRKSFSSMHR